MEPTRSKPNREMCNRSGAAFGPILQPLNPVLSSGRGALRRAPEYLSIKNFAPASELYSPPGRFFPDQRTPMKSCFVIFLLACATPAMAQGVSNSRDGSGNLARDRVLAAGIFQPHPMTNRATRQQPAVIIRKPQ